MEVLAREIGRRPHFPHIMMREMAENHRMSLAKVLQDALLIYEGAIAAGHEPGAALAGWTAERPEQPSEA